VALQRFGKSEGVRLRGAALPYHRMDAGRIRRSIPMLRKIMIVFATAAALAAGLTANAFAFSGGVSHVVTHPVSMAPYHPREPAKTSALADPKVRFAIFGKDRAN
jgi:hypothetical protein